MGIKRACNIFLGVPIIFPMTYADLIKHFGSQAEISRALKLAQPSVWQWQHDGVPEQRQYQIEVLTDGALKADRRVSA